MKKTGVFVLHPQNTHRRHISSRVRNVQSAHAVRNLVQRLDALARTKRGVAEGVLPLIGSEFGLTLKQYLQLLPPHLGLTKRVARALGVSHHSVLKWANQVAPIPQHTLIDLARITQGQVTRVK